MNPQMSLLKASIDADLREIAGLYQRLDRYGTDVQEEEQAILVGYYLHNLYTAFENICLNVAKTFENQIEDRSQWHSLLLKRMTLDIEGVRPRLFHPETYTCLDELRRFRHIFRNAYSISLDPQRIQLVVLKAHRLKALYETDLQRFQRFLTGLDS